MYATSMELAREQQHARVTQLQASRQAHRAATVRRFERRADRLARRAQRAARRAERAASRARLVVARAL